MTNMRSALRSAEPMNRNAKRTWCANRSVTDGALRGILRHASGIGLLITVWLGVRVPLGPPTLSTTYAAPSGFLAGSLNLSGRSVVAAAVHGYQQDRRR